MNKLIFIITIIFFLNACSHKVTYKTCAGPSNPQQEYHSLNSFIGSVFPPAVLLTTPFFLLQTQKNMNFADNETVRQQGVNDSNINKVLEYNKNGQFSLWENRDSCWIKAFKPIQTSEYHNEVCRDLEWYYFEYGPWKKGSASTGVSTYCRKTKSDIVKDGTGVKKNKTNFTAKKQSLPYWSMTNDYTHCSSDIYNNEIVSNTCYNENQESFNFPFSLKNPYGKHEGNDIWGGDVFTPVNTLQK